MDSQILCASLAMQNNENPKNQPHLPQAFDNITGKKAKKKQPNPSQNKLHVAAVHLPMVAVCRSNSPTVQNLSQYEIVKITAKVFQPSKRVAITSQRPIKLSAAKTQKLYRFVSTYVPFFQLQFFSLPIHLAIRANKQT